MKITLLGQGYEATSELSVGNQLKKFLSQKDFHTFTGISAFASPSGVIGLGKHILNAKHLNKVIIIVGVDKKGTSKEALEALVKMEINAYVFHDNSNAIFHPKIYLFEGKEKSELIIGSSNLTSFGLFSNVEASLLVSIDNSIEEDRKIVQQLKKYFKGLFDLSDPNLKKLTSKLISDLVAENLVGTEAERRAAYEKEEKSGKNETGNIISRIFPKREIAKIPVEFLGRTKPKEKDEIIHDKPTGSPSPKGNLVWTRKKLPSSSVQGGVQGTNPTGGLRLVQDDFIIKGRKIDQTNYFRNDLFGKYDWKQIRSNPFVEAAKVPFEVTINEEFIGRFDLEIRHKPSGEAGQHNYTTSISWGELGTVIKESSLEGSRLDLYSPKGKSKAFQIIIS